MFIYFIPIAFVSCLGIFTLATWIYEWFTKFGFIEEAPPETDLTYGEAMSDAPAKVGSERMDVMFGIKGGVNRG